MSLMTFDDTALFLDLDGTLAEFETDPQAVGPVERRTRLLRELGMALDGRLAVISGRELSDLDRILDGVVPALAGVHGLERRDAGFELHAEPVAPGLDAAAAEAEAFARGRDGVLVERKRGALALHTRAAPEHEGDALALARRLADRHRLHLQPGARVAEIRTPGLSKGDAIRAFLSEPPFLGARPVFLGDDLTDEDGFEAVLACGGLGVLVGAPRPTAAGARLASVSAVFDWLERSLRDRAFESPGFTAERESAA